MRKLLVARSEIVFGQDHRISPADLDNVKKVQAGYKAEPVAQ